MSGQTETILEQALRLPIRERAQLAERLLESVVQDTDPRIDALWAAEAERRIAAYRRWELSAVDADDVFDEIEGRLD